MSICNKKRVTANLFNFLVVQIIRITLFQHRINQFNWR